GQVFGDPLQEPNVIGGANVVAGVIEGEGRDAAEALAGRIAEGLDALRQPRDEHLGPPRGRRPALERGRREALPVDPRAAVIALQIATNSRAPKADAGVDQP